MQSYNSFYGFSVLTLQSYLTSGVSDKMVLDLSGKSLFECIEKMCDVKERLHPGIRRNYRLSMQKIRKLEDSFNCCVFPCMITSVFWSLFVPWLSDQGLKYSTINQIKQQIIAALNWCSKYGVKLNQSYNEVVIPKYTSTKIALTPDEISHIYHFKIHGSISCKTNKKIRSHHARTLEKVRDMFVLSCNLGQRYSDMVRIKPENFRNGVFTITQQKTGNKCKVDIDKMSMDRRVTYEILEKYGYRPPYSGLICDFNRYIKELLQIIGDEFMEEVVSDTKVNGVVEKMNVIKYKKISSHCARRTFCTVNVLKGIQFSTIMRSSGHSSEKNFMKYICYDE